MVRYRFAFGATRILEFVVDEERDPSAETPGEPLPEWVRLDRFRCENCSLPKGSRWSCPAALAMREVVEAFTDHMSYEVVEVEVETRGVAINATLPTTAAVRSILGLQLALSSCPILRKLRPMAHHHVPFATREHTSFRFIGAYLIGQVLRRRHGLAHEWELEGLMDLMQQIHLVNRNLADRLRAASHEDATVNGLVFLDTFAQGVEVNLERGLSHLAPLFGGFLDD